MPGLGNARALVVRLMAAATFLAPFAPIESKAQGSSIDDFARTVLLRDSCLAADGVSYLDNCFDSTTALTAWLWGGGRTNEPSMMDPVTVNVGPGEFEPFVCEGGTTRGFVSLAGAGRAVSRFVSTDASPSPQDVCEGGINVSGCTGLMFRNLSAEGIGTGARWFGEGDARWQAVDFIAGNDQSSVCAGQAVAWFDASDAEGTHHFASCRFDSAGSTDEAVAFFNGGLEVTAYGSDFKTARTGNITDSGDPVVVFSTSPEGITITASTVRGVVTASSSGGTIVGLKADDSGTIDMFGGIINLNATAHSAGTVRALWALALTSSIRTGATAFNFAESPTTSNVRVYPDAGTVESAFLWQSRDTPLEIESAIGADLLVKRNSGPGSNEARLFLYDAACGPDKPWRGVVGGTCM